MISLGIYGGLLGRDYLGGGELKSEDEERSLSSPRKNMVQETTGFKSAA